MNAPYGPVTQLAWVTDDLDATETALGAALGVAAWTRLPDVHFAPDSCFLRGEPADFSIDVSLAYAGDLQLELIRPVRGSSMYAEFLTERGSGLHHVCCEVPDMDAAMARARREGIDIVQHGTMAGGMMRFAYLDLATAGAAYLELSETGPDLLGLYEAIKAASRG